MLVLNDEKLPPRVVDRWALGIGVARGGSQGDRAPPNQNTTNDKKLWQHSLAMFSCSFFSAFYAHNIYAHNSN